jgi:hypothetical protein
MHSDDIDERVQTAMKFHLGQKNAVGRWDLVIHIFGLGADLPRTDQNRADRAIRKSVERLRSNGLIICNLGDGSGWFLPASAEEYRSFRAMYGSHAFPILDNIKAMDRTAQDTWPNPLQPGLL